MMKAMVALTLAFLWERTPEGVLQFYEHLNEVVCRKCGRWKEGEPRLGRSYCECYPKTRPIPSYGDHMLIGEFEARVNDGLFIDDDGTGHYATESRMSDKRISPSDVAERRVDRTYSHVVWFNK
jgi:hypothetical protein